MGSQIGSQLMHRNQVEQENAAFVGGIGDSDL